jgi:hypothetical protein
MLDSLTIVLLLLAIAALSLPERVAVPTCIPFESRELAKGEDYV